MLCFSSKICSLEAPCTACAKSEAAVARLNQLEAEVTRAKAEVLALRTAQNHCHDPLHKLPREIVSRIFEAFYESHPEFGQRSRSPFTLGRVCRLWRQIAWSTPNLWSSVSFCLKPAHENKKILELLEQYIARSGAVPLTIHILWGYTTRKITKYSKEFFQRLIFILRSCVLQWSSLHLELLISTFRLLVNDLPRPHPSTLRHLSWYPADDYENVPEDIPAVDLTSVTHGLESLEVEDNDFVMNLDDLMVERSRLTRMVGPVFINAWMRLLRASPRLKTAHLILTSTAKTKPVLGGSLNHNALQELEITSSQPSLLGHLLNQLTCTSLQTLRIGISSMIAAPATPQPQDLSGFLSRSGQNLRRMVLHWVDWASIAELQQSLTPLPRLEELTIYYPLGLSASHIIEGIFARISVHSQDDLETTHGVGPSRFPSLRNFTLSDATWERTSSWDCLGLVEDHFAAIVDRPKVTMEPQYSAAQSLPAPSLKMHLRIFRSHLDSNLLYMRHQHLEVVEKLRVAGVHIEISVPGESLYSQNEDFINTSAQLLKSSEG